MSFSKFSSTLWCSNSHTSAVSLPELYTVKYAAIILITACRCLTQEMHICSSRGVFKGVVLWAKVLNGMASMTRNKYNRMHEETHGAESFTCSSIAYTSTSTQIYTYAIPLSYTSIKCPEGVTWLIERRSVLFRDVVVCVCDVSHEKQA